MSRNNISCAFLHLGLIYHSLCPPLLVTPRIPKIDIIPRNSMTNGVLSKQMDLCSSLTLKHDANNQEKV